MGALSVVICAILSSLFLNEKLSFFGWLGCALCVVRAPATVSCVPDLSPHPSAWLGHHRAQRYCFAPSSRSEHGQLSWVMLTGPQEESIGQITEFQKLFLSPGFLVYGGILIAAALVIVFYFAPRCVHQTADSRCHLYGIQVWQEEHVVVHHGVQYDRRHQRQRHNRFGFCHRNHGVWRQSSKMVRFF